VPPLASLRFKIVTSFVIAALGLIMFVRLYEAIGITPTTVLDFIAPVLFIVAGIWRGIILMKSLRAVRPLVKS
jgi:hypothetical protein